MTTTIQNTVHKVTRDLVTQDMLHMRNSVRARVVVDVVVAVVILGHRPMGYAPPRPAPAQQGVF